MAPEGREQQPNFFHWATESKCLQPSFDLSWRCFLYYTGQFRCFNSLKTLKSALDVTNNYLCFLIIVWGLCMSLWCNSWTKFRQESTNLSMFRHLYTPIITFNRTTTKGFTHLEWSSSPHKTTETILQVRSMSNSRKFRLSFDLVRVLREALIVVYQFCALTTPGSLLTLGHLSVEIWTSSLLYY